MSVAYRHVMFPLPPHLPSFISHNDVVWNAGPDCAAKHADRLFLKCDDGRIWYDCFGVKG